MHRFVIQTGRAVACCVPVAVLSLCVSAAAAPVVPGEDAGSARDRALRLALEGRCRAALPELDAAAAADPGDARVALRAGQCRVRLHRYAEAAIDLERAASNAPATGALAGEVQLALAKARYHARDLQGAARALDAAGPLRPDDAEVALYRGLLAAESGDDAAAISHFERARRLDAERVEPVASLELARARARSRDTEGAERALRRVADAWQGTDWSTRAEQELGRLRAGQARHAWIALGAGFEYDDNVVLRGRGVPQPSDISGDDDGRGVWTANAGLELWKSERTATGLMAGYRGTTHIELHDFDAHYPSVTAWLDHDLSEVWTASGRYDFGYAWLDGDPFVATHSWQAALLRDFARLGQSELHGLVHLDDYFFRSDDVPDACGAMAPICGPPGIDERRERNRSGWGLATGVEHTLPLPVGPLPVEDPALRGGYDFALFEARGREYTHRAHRVHLGLSLRLPLDVGLDASGAYAYRQYRHPSTYPDPPVVSGVPYTLSQVRRREETFAVQTELSRALTDSLSASARWRYVDNESNVAVFDYDQHVLGVYVTWAYGREL